MKTQPNPLVLKKPGIWVRNNDLDGCSSASLCQHEWCDYYGIGRYCRLCGAEEVE